jgi:hypothetical protein
MGFIREKTVKGNQYIYYCEKRRSRIKDGGNGKVVTIEKVLGKSVFEMPYLPYWLWDGLSVQEFIDSYANFRIKKFGYQKKIKFEIEWKLKKGKPVKGKIIFRAIPGTGVDARKAWPRYIRRAIQEIIDDAIAYQDYKTSDMDKAAYYLAMSEDSKRKLEKMETKYREWKKNPYRHWEENGIKYRYSETYGDDCLETIECYRDYASRFLDNYLSLIDRLVKTAPLSEQKSFKATIIQRCEKLAARPNFIDWYKSTYPD